MTENPDRYTVVDAARDKLGRCPGVDGDTDH